MDRQKPTTHIRHNDDFSRALIEATAAYFGGQKVVSEEGIPSLQKKGGEDDFSRKDPKAKANAADPAVDLRTGAGVKQSHGATIKYTNVVAKEEKEEKWEGSKEDKGEDKKLAKKHGMSMKNWEKSDADKKHDMKKEEWEKPEKEEKGEKKHKEGKAEEKKEKMKEAFNLYVEGVHYVFEKMDGKDDNGFTSCWKGYKKQGTKMKGGKEVNNCVKAGYEPIGELMLDEKAPPGAKYERMVKHIKKGYSEGGLTKKEKGIAYATAWKAKGKEKKEMKEGMDPVGKEDSDINNDGKSDKTDKYLAARRKKIGQVMQAKKKMAEALELHQEIEEEKK